MRRPGHKFAFKTLVCCTPVSDKATIVNESRSVNPKTRFHRTIGSSTTAIDAQLIVLERVYDELKQITRCMQRDDEDDWVRNDWRFAAMVVDRLCLFVFSVFIFLSTCGIMLSSTHAFV